MSYRILCGYDQSGGSEKAFEFALQLAKKFEGELHVVAVFQPAEAAPGVKPEALLESAREHFSASFEQLRGKATAAGIEVRLGFSVGYLPRAKYSSTRPSSALRISNEQSPIAGARQSGFRSAERSRARGLYHRLRPPLHCLQVELLGLPVVPVLEEDRGALEACVQVF